MSYASAAADLLASGLGVLHSQLGPTSEQPLVFKMVSGRALDRPGSPLPPPYPYPSRGWRPEATAVTSARRHGGLPMASSSWLA